MRKTIKIAGIVGLVVLAASSASALFGRPHIDNQPIDSSHSIQAQPGTSSALAAVLARSCADCHSNTVTTRWYTRMPPFSALMAHAASEGRKAVNFSEWTAYSPARQQALLLSSCNDANRGTMPVKAYLLFRSDAVSVETVVEYLNKNVRNAQIILREALKQLKSGDRDCKCGSALKHAIFTAPDLWPAETTKKLEAIVKKYQT